MNICNQEPDHFEFRFKFTYGMTAIGSVYFKNVKLMDCMANLNYMIQEGLYPIKLYPSPKFKREVVLLDVPGHTYIEVHPADWSSELKGCFAVGSFDGWNINPKKTLTKLFADSNSTKYLNELIEYMISTKIEYLKVVHSECLRVYLTGRQ